MAIKEIEAVQALNKRASGNKTYHLIVSFRENDNPTIDQLRAIEQGMADALGLGEHQRAIVVHGDTDHLHMHLAINLVHPETHRKVTPYRDFYHLAAACRRFELEFGFQIDNGISDAERISERAGNQEAHQGIESFQRWVQGEPKQRLQAALDRPDITWQMVHQALAEYNLEIKPRGAGLVVVDRDDSRFRIRASDMGRAFSAKALEAKLGVYQPLVGRRPRAQQAFSERPLKHVHGARAAMWVQYQREASSRRQAIASAWSEYRRDREKAFGALVREMRERRLAIRLNRGMRRKEKQAAYSLLRMERAQREARLREQFAERRKQIRAEHRSESFQQFLERRAEMGDEQAVTALRAAGHETVLLNGGNQVGGDHADFRFFAFDFHVHRNGDVSYRLTDTRQAIRDTRSAILVGDKEQTVDDRTIEIALRMAQQKFGGRLTLNGSDQFRQRAAQLAGELGMRVHFKDDKLEAIRQAAARPKVSHVKHDALAAYAKASRATVIRPGEEAGARFRGVRTLRDGRAVGVFIKDGRKMLLPLSENQVEQYRQRPFDSQRVDDVDGRR